MQKSKKRFEISCNFSRQGYASDLRSRQSFLTVSVQLVGDVQYLQQALPCCVAFVLLGVRGIHILCTVRSNLRQNYESIAAHLWFLAKVRDSRWLKQNCHERVRVANSKILFNQWR